MCVKADFRKWIKVDFTLTTAFVTPQFYYDLSIAFRSPPIGWDGEPETIKRVYCKAALNPQDYYDPSIALGLPPLGLGWMGAGDNKKS